MQGKLIALSILCVHIETSSLWAEFVNKRCIIIIMWKMDPMSGFDIRLVFTLPPGDSTLQYKRCVHLWNNLPCIKSLQLAKSNLWLVTTLWDNFWIWKLRDWTLTLQVSLLASNGISKKSLINPSEYKEEKTNPSIDRGRGGCS